MTPDEFAARIAEAIYKYAPELHVPLGMNAVAILQALVTQEITDPDRLEASKHENSYCYGGQYRTSKMKAAEWRWGCAVHCSWSPFQIMYATAFRHGYTGDPVGLRDPMVAAEYVVKELNRAVFDKFADETIEDVFDAWNSGTARDKIDPVAYKKSAGVLYRQFAGIPEPRMT